MAEFLMPSLGADMDFGTLVEWTVKPGDHVKRGEIIALVDTDKGLIEIEVFEDGTVDSLAVTPGTKVPVGAVLAMITPDGAPAKVEAPKRPTPKAPAEKPAPGPPPPRPVAGAPPSSTRSAPGAEVGVRRAVRVSPLARRRAEELGIDLSAVTPGEGGVIRVADVERSGPKGGEASLAAGSTAPAAGPAPGPEARLAAMRRAIASAMARSKREIPHYYLQSHVDASRMLAWLAEENRKRAVTDRLLHAVLLLKAVALAAREVPEVNGFYSGGEFRASDRVHVGVAISLRQGGLVAPALHDVDGKPLDQLMKELLDLTRRARSGVLRSSEVADATLTVTNLGDQGVESVLGVIYPPQVALVGFGRIFRRPWAEEGMVGVRPVLSSTLAADHRASDGHRGGRFLAAVERLLQTPEAL